MCGISGILNLDASQYPNLERHLSVMNKIQEHRGPDDSGVWVNRHSSLGFGHRRLTIIDLNHGSQPMTDAFGCTITYNGEIYNYKELKEQLSDYPFKTNSDTEVILAAYQKWGEECVQHFRGMFAFAVWDEKRQALFCARDRFGIKPFYYYRKGTQLFFASEIKALLPFVEKIETDLRALHDYIVFQFCLGEKTLFKGVKQLLPAHTLTVHQGKVITKKYWEVYFNLNFDQDFQFFQEKLNHLITESVHLHTRSDVPIGSYLSGGVDSSLVASIASSSKQSFCGFHGKFSDKGNYDESEYAMAQSKHCGISLEQVNIGQSDFVDSIEKIIYHLDYPVAGPGSFPQYHVSKLVSKSHKVVLGGQGGDEIFGGYTRYLIAYFEQCIKAAINGTSNNGNFIVTYESIIPNLSALKSYQPLLKHFWKEGLFNDLDQRYYHLINRAPHLEKEICWEIFDPGYKPFDSFQSIFHGKNIVKESYFDSMTHFDFKTLLPALLHVEDRMSMAHSVESRVPFVDHKIVEFAATMPSNIKFQNGTLKRILTRAMQDHLCPEILDRKDKMGFPVPLNDWLQGPLHSFAQDLFASETFRSRPYFNHGLVANSIEKETTYGRGVWGLLSLEIWHRLFHDQHHRFKKMLYVDSVDPVRSKDLVKLNI